MDKHEYDVMSSSVQTSTPPFFFFLNLSEKLKNNSSSNTALVPRPTATLDKLGKITMICIYVECKEQNLYKPTEKSTKAHIEVRQKTE